MESLVVVTHARESFNAKLGKTAVILGVGCIGLITLMSLKVRGVSEIYVTDALDRRLEKAEGLGAARVFNGRNENMEEFVNLYPFHKDETTKAVIKM